MLTTYVCLLILSICNDLCIPSINIPNTMPLLGIRRNVNNDLSKFLFRIRPFKVFCGETITLGLLNCRSDRILLRETTRRRCHQQRSLRFARATQPGVPIFSYSTVGWDRTFAFMTFVVKSSAKLT